MSDRKSEAEIPPLIEDPIELAQKEAENALLQFDWGMEEVERWIADGKPKLRVSTLLNLHRKAMDGIDQYAGNFRPANVAIRGSVHQPISGDDVPRYVEEMLEYIADHWESKTATHLSSYAMWRLNWIHPFADGNGRTSRMLSYMVLCGRLGYVLPGTKTIPEQISENKQPYYNALEAADAANKTGTMNVSQMEKLLENYLANQLVDIHGKATGNDHMQPSASPPPERGGLLAALEKRPVFYGGCIAIVLAVIGWIIA
ncbi:Fic family protein [Gymnodinialimonas hymeniacidonis]|uniref:Fic family protein n=1 Tax=Gymnodinialimonas hymeniacidonis TaxID=3126508 RepID=UPI0034C692C0